ncbi:MAG: Hpt domain-containing protein, partial [Halorhodospira sp.]
MSVDLSQFLQTFFEESFEGLETMESGLLELDSEQPDRETLHNVFRAAHSIKGGAGTFGLTAVSDFTHRMETLLDRLRDGTQAVTADRVNVLLNAVDCLRCMLEAIQQDQPLDAEAISDAQSRLDQELAGGVSTGAQAMGNGDPNGMAAAGSDAIHTGGNPSGKGGDTVDQGGGGDGGLPGGGGAGGRRGGWWIRFEPQPHLFATG